MHGQVLFTGGSSKICEEFAKRLPKRVSLTSWTRHDCDLSDLAEVDKRRNEIARADRIVLCHGTLASERFSTRTETDLLDSLKVNLLSVVRVAEIALEQNPLARIAVLGSESGLKGSYDIAYALSKAALHAYVTERQIVHPQQQLVAIAPSTISDTGMTLRRSDQDRAKQIMQTNPKGRGVTSREVAELLYFLLFEDEGYITNTVVHMNGGKFARM